MGEYSPGQDRLGHNGILQDRRPLQDEKFRFIDDEVGAIAATDGDIDRCYGSQADPASDKAMRDNILNSRAIIDACRPLEWITDFPPVAEASPERRSALEENWGKLLD